MVMIMNETELKNRFKRPLLWAELFAILLLIGFSIYGAFIGADRAQAFFNSIPLSLYWAVFAVLLIASIILFRRLSRLPGLLMMHIGCVFVLAGAIWGSQAGFKIRDALLDTDTLRTGQMVIDEGMASNAVDTEQNDTKTLPFSVRLADFRMEYYEPGLLMIQTPQDEEITVPARPGLSYTLGGDLGSIEIVRQFEHFRIILQEDKRIAMDDAQGDLNPALELRLTRPDGTWTTRYAFQNFNGHSRYPDGLQFQYYRMVRDFISDLEVVKDGIVLARKSIEVNKPLHFGGVLFYQQSYDAAAGRFTVLKVTSDRGHWIVFSGYILLCAGTFWHLWIRHLLRGSVSRTKG
jgi:hypothetical protein